ncbi:MAG: hypothetical protein K2N06_06590 [Oscillospiraceae bacterium]|nr:hypothetical protein [Oscillospiraceae bacterium]
MAYAAVSVVQTGSSEPYSAVDAWKHRRAYDFALWITQTAQREPNLAFSDSHAAAVTRTEVNAVCNLAAMDATYRQGKRFKTWKTFGDSRVRPSHKAVDGQRMPLDMPFTVGGYEMMFPNDSSLGAPAGEVVNCRCVLEFDDGKVLTNSREHGLRRTREKLQNDASNNWNGANPTPHTVEELRELNQYAEERGIKLYNRIAFDGDINLIKAQIDTMAKIRADFGHTDFIRLGWKRMNPGDFGETSANHQQIWINALALRNREITELNLSVDNFLAANQATGIVAHEMGHVISGKLKKGITGLDIYKQTVYNVSGKIVSDDEAVTMLLTNVSVYSGSSYFKNNDRRCFDELIPEMLSVHYTEPNEYSSEFVKLLKGALE